MSTLTDVVTDVLDRHRFRWASEVDLHEGLGVAFVTAGLVAHREVTLGRDGRIDFVLTDPAVPDRDLGVEVKVAGSVPVVARQLLGYARHVDELMLVTTRAQHLTLRLMRLPNCHVEDAGQLHVHHLRGGGL